MSERITTTTRHAAGLNGDVVWEPPSAQREPAINETRSRRSVAWTLQDVNFLHTLTPTLAEVEAFCAKARRDGAPNEAIVRGFGNRAQIAWWVDDVEDLPDVPAHVIDSEGDIWLEQEDGLFELLDLDDPEWVDPSPMSLERVQVKYGIKPE